jgi:hypothetical protein
MQSRVRAVAAIGLITAALTAGYVFAGPGGSGASATRLPQLPKLLESPLQGPTTTTQAGTRAITYVSARGNNANPCTRIAPCRTFAAAIAQTADRGEVIALDSGSYGMVRITQSLTLRGAPGTHALIATPAQAGTAVWIETPGVSVTLRNIYIDGGASTRFGTTGIYYVAGDRVHLEDCVLANLDTAINFTPGPGQFSRLSVVDTLIRNTTTFPGFLISGRGTDADPSTAMATLEHVRMVRTGGVAGYVSLPNVARVMIRDSLFTFGGYGVIAIGSGSKIALSNVTASNNSDGIVNSSGTIYSFGNNQAVFNTFGDVQGTITKVPQS